jgi:iron complex transport system substrate-binding protein
MRIASFLPSATETLFAIGAGDQVCAITFECDHPVEAHSKPHVVFSHLPPGLTPAEIDAIVSAEGAQGRSFYFVEYDRLESLAPTLVVLQDLCRVCAIDSPTLARDMSRLSSAPQVVSLAAHSIADILREIEMLGDLTGHATQAHTLTQSLAERIERIREARSGIRHRKRVLCLEWLDPPFLGGHWVPEMTLIVGADPVLSSPATKSVRTTWQQIAATEPEVIVLMPCGFNLQQTIDQFHALALPPEWHNLPAVRAGEVYAVNGSAYFSRHGPRFIDGLEILDAILHPTNDSDDSRRFAHLPAESVRRAA